MSAEFTDHVIVGSGPGGAVAAHALHEAKKDFLILEAGPDFEDKSLKSFSPEEMQQTYRKSGITFAWGNPKIPFAEGRVIGGGSEINAGLYHRTPKDVIQKWQLNHQIKDFTEEHLSEHFQFVENFLSIAVNQNASSGAGNKLAAGASALNWDCKEVPSWFHSSDRRSMSKTFLKPLRSKILADSEVLNFKKQKDYWVLRIKQKNHSVTEIKTKTIFLASGAISTPWLLKKSLSVPSVGKTLQLHPNVKLTARFSENINLDSSVIPHQQVKGFAPGMSIGCSISSPSFLASAMLDHPEHFHHVKDNSEKMAIYYGAIEPEAKGKISSYLFGSEPKVKFQLTPSDFDKLMQVMGSLVKLLFEAGAVEVYPQAANFGAVRSYPEFLQKKKNFRVNNLRVMALHLFSSCPMGESAHCPVDSFGKLKSHNGLYISDASILPSAPGVNPQGTIMALSRRNILHFLSNAGTK